MYPEKINNLDESNEQSENRPLYSSFEKIFLFINSNNQIYNIKEEKEDNRYLFTYSYGETEKNGTINICSSNKRIISSKKSESALNANSNSKVLEFDEINKNTIFNKLLNSGDKNNDNQNNENKPKKLLFKIKKINVNDKQKVNNLLNKKRQGEKKTYKGTKYLDNFNIKNKLLTHFLNRYIKNSNNYIIKQAGCTLYFRIFPRNLILHFIAKERTKELFKMTLGEIYTNEKLYDEKNIKSHFAHNSEVIKQLFSVDKYKYVKEQSGIKEKLEMKISDLFQKYLNSDEFKDDIDGLKVKSGEDYVEKYLKNAKNLCI
jgi:hypothetical protein